MDLNNSAIEICGGSFGQLLFLRLLEIFPEAQLLGLCNQLCFFKCLEIFGVKIGILRSVQLREAILEDLIGDFSGRMINPSIQITLGTLCPRFVALQLHTYGSMQEELLSKGLAVRDEVFVDTLLRGEDVHHGNFSDRLEFVDVHTQVRGIKDILDYGLQRLTNRL